MITLPLPTRQQLEARRIDARARLDDGMAVREVAREYAVTYTSVIRWKRAKSLVSTRSTGRPRKADPAGIDELIEAGFTEAKHLRMALKDRYRITYTHDHCNVLLRRYRARAAARAGVAEVESPPQVRQANG